MVITGWVILFNNEYDWVFNELSCTKYLAHQLVLFQDLSIEMYTMSCDWCSIQDCMVVLEVKEIDPQCSYEISLTNWALEYDR